METINPIKEHAQKHAAKHKGSDQKDGLLMSVKNEEFPQITSINDNASLDSCMLYIPANKCTNIDESLTRTTLLTEVDIETGECVESVGELRGAAPQKRAITYKQSGITYTFAYRTRVERKGFSSIQKEYIACAISAKMLESLYLTGINASTLKALHANIMKQGLFKCTLTTFKDSIASDIDIKKDMYIQAGTFQKFIQGLKDSVKPEFKKCTVDKFPKVSKADSGLQIGKRNDKLVPLLKFYNKTKELLTNSNEFNNAFVQITGYNVKEVIRMEYTINGAKEAKRLGLITKEETLSLGKLIQLIEQKSPINAIFVSVLKERFFEANNSNDIEEPKNSMEIKDTNFSKAKGDVIYSVCFSVVYEMGASLDYAKKMAEKVLACSTAQKKRFLPIALDIATRAYEDAKEAIGMRDSKAVINETGVFSMFGLTN